MHGVDVSTEQIEAGRALGIRNLHCGDLVRFLQEHHEAYDCITALDVLEHFPKGEVLTVVDGIHEALKPDGRVIIQAPNGAEPVFRKVSIYRFHAFRGLHEGEYLSDLACSGIP